MNTQTPSPETIRIATLGLDSDFHPIDWMRWTRLGQVYPWLPVSFPKSAVVAAATLGRSDEEIRNNGGQTPEEIAGTFGLKLYCEAEELLDKEKPHGVFICGRPSVIPAIALKCIERGIHVYLQKPASTNAGELDQVAKAAEKHGVQAAAGATWRHDGAVMATRDQLAKVDIGKICSLRVMYNHGMPEAGTWYSDPEQGGPELWLGWYNIDLLHHFACSKVRRLFATAHRGSEGRGQPHTIVHASCILEDGTHGSIDLYGNIRCSYPRAEWEILGEKGMVRNVRHHDVEVYLNSQPQQGVHLSQFFDGVGADISAWLNSWSTGKTNGMTVAEAADVVRVATAITRSFNSGQAVDV